MRLGLEVVLGSCWERGEAKSGWELLCGLRREGDERVVSQRKGHDHATGHPVCDELNAGSWLTAASSACAIGGELPVELSSFPRGKHDDWVDTWTQARALLGEITHYSMNATRTLPGWRGFYLLMAP